MTLKDFGTESKLFVIGGGKMGEAIVGGILSAGVIAAESIFIIEPNPERRTLFEQSYGVAAQKDTKGIIATMDDVVLLAVKPQSMKELLTSCASQIKDALIISIAVGLDTAFLSSFFTENVRVVKAMPNTPALVREGVTLLSASQTTPDKDLELARELFASFGSAYIIEESKQNVGASISGSGPAYFALIVDSLTRAGVRQGLPRELAEKLANQTMAGTAAMLDQLDIHPEQLVDMVSSPGGTTIAAVSVLEDYKIRAAFDSAIQAAVKRAEEL